MMFKLFLNDVRKSRKIIYYGIFIPVFLGITRFMALMISSKGIIEKLTMSDIFYYGFMGIRYSDLLSSVLNLGFWLCLNISIIILCSYYINTSLDTLGLQYLIRCKNKSYWFLSKTLFVIVISLEYYLAYIITLCLCGIISKVLWVKYIHIEKILFISGFDKASSLLYTKSNTLNTNILILTVITSICLSIIGSLMGYFIIHGFNLLIMIIIYLLSVFLNGMFLLTVYTSLMRSDLYYIYGVNYKVGYILNITIVFVLCIIFNILFLHKNILQNE